jgi:hypothetical protein
MCFDHKYHENFIKQYLPRFALIIRLNRQTRKHDEGVCERNIMACYTKQRKTYLHTQRKYIGPRCRASSWSGAYNIISVAYCQLYIIVVR